MGMETVKQHFDEEARIFDSFIPKHVPGYSEMLEAVVASMPFEKSASLKAIDIGCGTGSLAKLFLDAFPKAETVCMDIAENMLEMAKAKLKGRKARFVAGDIQSYAFNDSYDAIISSLALHHLRTDADKQAVFKRIFDALRPGGAFFNADLVMGSNDFLETKAVEKWKEFLLLSISKEEVEGVWIPKFHAEDRPAKLTNQLAWLSETGFASVDVVWKRCGFAVYGGFKPSV